MASSDRLAVTKDDDRAHHVTRPEPAAGRQLPPSWRRRINRREVGAANRRGWDIRCSVLSTPLRNDDPIEGVILLMEPITD